MTSQSEQRTTAIWWPWPTGVAERRQLVVWWMFGLLFAGAMSLPVIPAMSSATRHLPPGDAAWFAPGATYLLEGLRVLREPLLGGLKASSLLLALGLLATPLVKSAFLATLPEHQSIIPGWRRAWSILPRLLLSSLTSLLVQLAVATSSYFGVAILLGPIQASLSERGADLVSLILFGVAALALILIRIWSDLWKAALVASSPGLLGSLATAMEVWRVFRWRVLIAWLVPAALGLGLVALGAWGAALLDVSQAGAWRIGVLGVVHQGLAFALIALRAAWLGRARGFTASRITVWGGAEADSQLEPTPPAGHASA